LTPGAREAGAARAPPSGLDQRHLRTDPRRGGGLPPGPPPGGFLRGDARRFLARRGSGNFSGRGMIGPSGYSKPRLVLPASSLTTTTRT